MKKVLCGFLCIALLLCFSGCTIHHSNSFVEGTYANDQFTLRVTAIDESRYKSKDVINVVEDDSINRTNKYYELELLMLDESGNYVEVYFVNLVQKAAKTEPCFYEDEKGNSICPQEIQRHVKYVLVINGQEYILD